MELKIFILSCIIAVGKSQTVCGQLKIVYTYNKTAESFDGKIRLYPSDEMETYIRQQQQYRWMFTNTSRHVILQKNSGISYDHRKYQEDDFTLTIWSLTSADEGTYTVECWIDGPMIFSGKAQLKIPEVTTTTMSTHPPASLTEPGINNTATIVVAVCAVIIVIIIAATVFVIWRKRAQNTESRRLLCPDKKRPSSVSFQRDNDNESVYNEIDIEVTLDYAKVADSAAANEGFANLCQSPALPDRPAECKERMNPCASATVSDVEYSEVIHSGVSHDSKEAEVENPASQRDEYELSAPVYAQVEKRKQDSEHSFEVTFPSIDCTKLTDSLGEHYLGPHMPDRNDKGPTYSNLVSKSVKRKSSERRSSRRDLQYAILNLSSPKSTDNEGKETATAPCQYADIDFEKKAFVAPVRKAPSSWYKRRKKKDS